MNVAVVGCGYVGLVSAVGIASRGHEVTGIEVVPERRERIAAGEAPFYEPGLAELLDSTLGSGAFSLAAGLEAAAEADVVFLAVQTPSDASGAIDLQYLERAAAELAAVFAGGPARRRVVVVRSTVVPGTAETLVAPNFDSETAVASNPEFLREGSAVADFTQPDRIVIGCAEEWGREILTELYEPFDAPLIFTPSLATAELAKYTSNAFLATLISFSNEIARVAESLPGVDVEDVLSILHSDRRLVPIVDGEAVRPEILSYLKAGVGYGGSCLPKDVSALIAAGRSRGESLGLLEAVREVNAGQPARIVDSIEQALGGIEGRAVTVLGLAFKGGTDDLRSSPGLQIVDLLLERGASVTAFDPLVEPGAVADREELASAATLPASLDSAEACVITTNAPEFSALGELLEAGGHESLVVVDGRRILAEGAVGEGAYVAVGRAPVASPQAAR